ncbi:hypothetical protein NBRC10513v2_003173 [Rhodotorula toruloides]
MHPKNLPALRYLRVSGGADAAIVLWAAELANQLVACQVGLCESTGWSQSHRRYAGGLVPEFSSALDKTLFELTTPPAAAAAPPQLGKIRYLLLTDQSRDMATAFLAFCPIQYTSLDAVFIPRKYRIVPATTSCDTSADAFLDAIKTLRAKVVWVEDWDTDFVVPEFERYIAEKKRRAA